MKSATVFLSAILIGALSGGVVFTVMKRREGDAKPGAEKAGTNAALAAPETPATHDATGSPLVKLDAEAQKRLALKTGALAAAQLAPEIRGYGHVLDPAPLAGLLNELAADRAAFSASSNEFARLKTLQDGGNASARAYQAAEAASARDELAIQSARERLVLNWGAEIADREDLPAFVRSLATRETVLVRIDLPAGQALAAAPVSARIITLTDGFAEGRYLGSAMGVDPQTLGRGFIFQVKLDQTKLLPGEAVTGYLKLPGDSLAGIIIPRDAVIRADGAGWVYVQTGNDVFTRKEVGLEMPTEQGWFVTNGFAVNDRVVIAGAQSVLSTELKTGKSGE